MRNATTVLGRENLKSPCLWVVGMIALLSSFLTFSNHLYSHNARESIRVLVVSR